MSREIKAEENVDTFGIKKTRKLCLLQVTTSQKTIILLAVAQHWASTLTSATCAALRDVAPAGVNALTEEQVSKALKSCSSAE